MVDNTDFSVQHIKEIYSHLIQNLNYCPKSPIQNTNVTYKALLSEVSEYNDGKEWFDTMCKESASLAELLYAHCTFDVRKHIAKFIWCLINIEDLGHKYPSSLAGFQAQILQQQRPEGKVLQSLLDSLTTFYRFWDPIPANCMSHSVLEFVNGSLLEQAPNVNNMKLSSAAKRWPYFLRRKTGISAAFAFAIFPKELNIDMSVYIQAIEDTVLFIDIFNDVLSFYKEYLSGERNNYVYNRARVNEKSTMETLQSVVDDALAAHSRAKKILEHTEAFLPWKSFLDGYISFHFIAKRYRLRELGFQLDGRIPEVVD